MSMVQKLALMAEMEKRNRERVAAFLKAKKEAAR